MSHPGDTVCLRTCLQVEGIPEEVIFDHLHATAFQNTPLGRTILGPADNIRRLTRGDLADYIGANYTAPRMVGMLSSTAKSLCIWLQSVLAAEPCRSAACRQHCRCLI